MFAALVAVWKWAPFDPPAVRELTRSELTLRGGVLFAHKESAPFAGRLVERYGPSQRKVEIQIREGKANGLSRGWYEDGQLEVKETFRDGVSHGTRTRWHRNGQKRAVALIEHGEVVAFSEWYENGQLATRMDFKKRSASRAG